MAETRARYCTIEILYDMQEVGLSSRCEQLNYTDCDQGRSDEISLTFCDKNADYLMLGLGGWVPEKGHDLDVTIWFHNWNFAGDLQRYHCGNFTLDDITYSGSPSHTCVIKGVSIPAESSFQTSPKSKTWEKVTLKQVAEEKMTPYGLTNYFYWADEPIIEKVEQSNEPDSSFMYKLCQQQGLFLKIYKKDYVIFDKKFYEPRPPKFTFGESDMENWTWNSTLAGTYTGARVSYTDPNKAKDKGAEASIQVLVGTEERLLEINQTASDEAEARRLAISKVNEANEKAVTVSFKVLDTRQQSTTLLWATENFGIEGMGRCDGKYYTSSVTHTVTGSGGHSMTVTGYKIFDRL